jgi:hypothetical protein
VGEYFFVTISRVLLPSSLGLLRLVPSMSSRLPCDCGTKQMRLGYSPIPRPPSESDRGTLQLFPYPISGFEDVVTDYGPMVQSLFSFSESSSTRRTWLITVDAFGELEMSRSCDSSPPSSTLLNSISCHKPERQNVENRIAANRQDRCSPPKDGGRTDGVEPRENSRPLR